MGSRKEKIPSRRDIVIASGGLFGLVGGFKATELFLHSFSRGESNPTVDISIALGALCILASSMFVGAGAGTYIVRKIEKRTKK